MLENSPNIPNFFQDAKMKEIALTETLLIISIKFLCNQRLVNFQDFLLRWFGDSFELDTFNEQ